MKIAVASGKGGTGKTTVSIALAETLGNRAVLLDCDAEEPNCHLFLSGKTEETLPVSVMVPQFDNSKCTSCGKCAKVCRFNAIAPLAKTMLIFQELCHSCGGCLLSCETGALTESSMTIGEISRCTAGDFPLITGKLQVGHALSVPLIKELKNHTVNDKINILDAPPGTACPMVTTVRGCDYVILVTEPTPFGLHDLAGAAATLKTLGIACGVIINRAEEGNFSADEYCHANNIDILMKIPFSRKIAEGYASGRTLLRTVPELKSKFAEVLAGLGAI